MKLTVTHNLFQIPENSLIQKHTMIHFYLFIMIDFFTTYSPWKSHFGMGVLLRICCNFQNTSERLPLELIKITGLNMPKYGLSVTRIFLYNFWIAYSVFIRDNKGDIDRGYDRGKKGGIESRFSPRTRTSKAKLQKMDAVPLPLW